MTQGADTFVRSNVSFTGVDAQTAVNELKEIKNAKGEQKFTGEKFDAIGKELYKNPEKWENLKPIAENPKMIGLICCDIAKKDAEDIGYIRELSELKKSDESSRFSPLEIRNLANNLSGQELVRAKGLAQSNLGIDKITEISKNPNLKNIDKLVDKINDLQNSNNKNVIDLSFETDKYNKKQFMLKATFDDMTYKSELLDRKLDTVAEETMELQTIKGKKYQVKKVQDYKNNTASKVTLECNSKMPIPLAKNEIRVIKDENGKVQRKECFELSDVEGTPNVRYVYPDGKVEQVSMAKRFENTGVVKVKKDMKSLDGTESKYEYVDNPQGDRILKYKITDKDGKVLLDYNQFFDVISDNKFISSKNGKSYEMTVNENNLHVKDMQTEEETTIEFDKIEGNKEKLIAALKQMPGDELMRLSEVSPNLEGVDNTLQSTWNCKVKKIKTGDNLYTALHELGHAKDYEFVNVEDKSSFMKSLFNNPEINETFEEEKAAFNEKFPEAQREHIGYFIENSDYKDGLQEAIAESNALLSTKNSEDIFAIRSHYLQQYFPKTIALLATELHK
jgi:uncharacterized protein YjhX (UPF0386 family)